MVAQTNRSAAATSSRGPILPRLPPRRGHRTRCTKCFAPTPHTTGQQTNRMWAVAHACEIHDRFTSTCEYSRTLHFSATDTKDPRPVDLKSVDSTVRTVIHPHLPAEVSQALHTLVGVVHRLHWPQVDYAQTWPPLLETHNYGMTDGIRRRNQEIRDAQTWAL